MEGRLLQLISFAVGAVLLAVGLVGVPLGELLLVIGSALASFSYAGVFFSWRAAKATPQVASSVAPQSPIVPVSPTEPLPPTPGTTTPTPPTGPAGAQLPTPEVKPSTGKAPRIKLPEPVIENRVPIALVAFGLVLVIAALAVLLPAPLVYFAGLFIPGLLLLALGSGLLFLHMRSAAPVVVEVRRFCMHCGFQMSSTDVSCPRCHRQPPSGVDTKVCPNCGAVIPMLAKFCRDCGAGQPAA
jgi:RNA polymerase subunit RPABC4/transcription elongation factor Spt4